MKAAPKINVNKKKIKTLIKKKTLPDCFTMSLYQFAPYQGCSHQCSYCDGRAEKYYVQGDFDTDIVVRENATDVLEREFKTLKRKGLISIGSGTTDCYQQSEDKYKLMSEIAKVVAERNYPIQIMTKSDLILRDIDLWDKVREKNGFILLVSLVFWDDKLREIFEPFAATVESRLKVIKEFKQKKFCVGVLMMPLLPGINDDNTHVKKLLKLLKSLEIDFVVPGHLTLRPGNQKKHFLNKLRQFYPEKMKYYNLLYSENKMSGNPRKSYLVDFYNRVYHLLSEEKICSSTPHSVYRNLIPIHDEIYILLSQIKEKIYNMKNYRLISNSLHLYEDWLKKNWDTYRRKKDYNNDIDLILKCSVENDSFREVIKNNKVFDFFKKIVIERKVYDFHTMKFEKTI